MIIITGASRGIGKFLLEKFISEKNEKVIGIYNSTPPDQEYEKYYSKLDLLNFENVTQWIKSMNKDFTDLILLNCAGNNYNSFESLMDFKCLDQINSFNLFYVIPC